MKMTAAVVYAQGLPMPYAESRPFTIEQVDLEGPGEGEVLVEIKAAGLCHSDLSSVAGLRKRVLPMVGGHEGAGIVREIGRGVFGLEEGDHVVLTTASGCGYCRPCRGQRPVLCEEVGAARIRGVLPNGARRLSIGGKPLYHYVGVSCFAQYAIMVPGALVKIDKKVPFEVAAMFGCAVVTGAGAVFNTARVIPGDTVAVFGLGGVGLNAVMAAKIAGASQIIGIDINESKFALALELGCTRTFLATDPALIEQVRDLTAGGVDVVIETSGHSPAMASAYMLLCRGGEIVCVGLPKSGDVYQLPHASLVGEEKAVRGSLLGSCIAQRDVPLYLNFYMEGRLPVDRLQSGTMRFEELNENLDKLHRGSVVRQILLPA